VRVTLGELGSILHRLAREGDPYGGADLDGAVVDLDHAIVEGGFSPQRIVRTGDAAQMVRVRCDPVGDSSESHKILAQLERAWIAHGAFAHEAHSITVAGEIVVLDFVTWWEDERFLSGRIEVPLEGNS
jgi:hypothetical protein